MAPRHGIGIGREVFRVFGAVIVKKNGVTAIPKPNMFQIDVFTELFYQFETYLTKKHQIETYLVLRIAQ
jgi:hypothetical protein